MQIETKANSILSRRIYEEEIEKYVHYWQPQYMYYPRV